MTVIRCRDRLNSGGFRNLGSLRRRFSDKRSSLTPSKNILLYFSKSNTTVDQTITHPVQEHTHSCISKSNTTVDQTITHSVQEHTHSCISKSNTTVDQTITHPVQEHTHSCISKHKTENTALCNLLENVFCGLQYCKTS